MDTRRSAAAAIIALALLAPLFVHSDARAACGGPPMSDPLVFQPPQVVDQTRAGGEPSVLGLRDGTLIYSTHAGTTHMYKPGLPDADFVTPYSTSDYVWRSTDGGATWSYVGLAGGPLGPHATVTGFSDPTLAEDLAGNVYVAGIDLAQVSVARSADSGKTWTGRPFDVLLTDREWLAADEPNVLYMNGNMIIGGRRLWKSLDGGFTWSSPTGITLGGSGPPAPITVDQRDGTLYFPSAKPFVFGWNEVQIFRGARKGDFTSTVSYVKEGLPSAFGFFNSSAVDQAGNVYIASNTANSVRIAASTDHGETWTTTEVASSSNAMLWPWVSAGSDGRVAVSWLESDSPVSDVDTQASSYRVFTAVSTTAHGWEDACGQAQEPIWQTSLTTPVPIHQGTICTSGTACNTGVSSDRRLGDYISNSITADGRVVVAYGSTTLAKNGAISHPGFSAQASGPDLRG